MVFRKKIFIFFLFQIPFYFIYGFEAKPSNHLNVATWNVRQATQDKLQNQILVNGDPLEIYKFIGQWVSDRQVDVLAMQEVYEKHRSDLSIKDDPIQLILSELPSSFKVIQGTEIRSDLIKGKHIVWKAFCPIFYDSTKINCEASQDQMLPLGLDYNSSKNPVSENYLQSRYMQWAYCQNIDENFDFVMTCLHANYKVAEEHVRGTVNVVNQIFEQNVIWPRSMSKQNLDFVLAGDFNLDRRTSVVFENLSFKDQNLNFELPTFVESTRWKRKSFTKLKDIYTFSEARKRSTDIYDDIINSNSMSESLVIKKVDSLIDDYFIKPTSRKVDMKSLLSLSDHLPVISTFDMALDAD